MSTPKVVTTDLIPRSAIDPDALKVIARLRRYGHEAYLVGGCVRDLLLGVQPKDFDVITSARPRQVRRLFSNSRVIGRRFRLVHVIFGDNVIEVSTFRADPAAFEEQGEPVAGAAEARAAEGGEAPPDASERPADAASAADAADAADAANAPGDEADEADQAEEDLAADDEPEASDGEDDAQDEELGGGPVSLSELGEIVGTVHDPLDPDDPGPKAELEPDIDAAIDQPGVPSPEEEAEADEALEEDLEEREEERHRRRNRGPTDEELDANNMFGDPEQDARRRDFTINALFYDPDKNEIIDYTGGLDDIERKLVNPINDPDVAFAEDPVRMIRAARFAAKLGLTIEQRAMTATARHRGLLAETSQRRLLEEVLKILKGGYASRCMDLLISTGMVEQFLPDIAQWLAEQPALPPPPPPAPEVAPALEAAPVLDAAPAPEAALEAANEAATPSEVTAPAAAEPTPEPESAAEPTPEPVETAALEAPAAEHGTNGTHTAAGNGAEHARAPEGAEAAEQADEADQGDDDLGPAYTVGTTGIVFHPDDEWEPDQRMVDAYLRVTWDRPPPEGANDVVEDPHIHLMDGIFEAAAFARDVVLNESGHAARSALAAERERAAAVLRVLRWNGRLAETVASFPDDEPHRGARRRRGGRHQRPERQERHERHHDRRPARGEHAARAPRPHAQAAHGVDEHEPDESPVADLATIDRRHLLLGYLEGLDRLIARGVPLSPAVQLSMLFAPMLLTRLDEALRKRGPSRMPSSEELADALLFPIARRHSLARRDRDHMKRIVLSLRRLLTGELRRRARHGSRLGKVVSRDYFREAIVLLWLHCRVTNGGWDEFRYWETRAKTRAR